ncbi:fibronectin type 3 domain-containing protein [Geodermatophilus siccatus]|uniref:Fibronectin type 3 domain-containing protein n=1 Tax=Geodermatophilus siccatus TaxID=1137991 RepID=A0A1G9PKN3_9ACTN|nr:fibronectin type III domain-containing protein [Geodermatophilus siccatus]SDL99274.1 fibronectin type 3 domain-containing protein [Geodermatophilus siccatus]
MRDVGADQRAVRRRRGPLLRLSTAVLAVLTVALSGQTPPAPRLETASTQDPAPPASVVVTGADRALAVSWSASTETATSGYQVFVDAETTPRVTTSASTRTATLTGLVNGREYTVTVRTVTTETVFLIPRTYLGQSGTAARGTPRDSVAPAAPTGVGAVRGDGRVSVSWTANSADYDADGYRVLRDGVDISGLLAGRVATSWTDTGLVNDRTYAYSVQTHDTSNNWSVPSAPAVSATPTDLTPPAAPTGLVGGRGDGRAGLSWTANAEPDLASYRVLRDGVEVATVTGTTYLDPGLTNDRTYSYALVAVDGHGNRSPTSAAVQVTPTDLTPPSAPTGLTAVRGDGQVTLAWAANPEPDLASYRVLRDGVEVATVTGTTYTDSSLVNDTTYRYALAAVDTHGNRSISSAAVTATPQELDAPAPPTGLAATAGDRRVDLSWTANTEIDLGSYRVLRDGAVLATVTGATGYTDTAVVNDTTYAYAVVAVDTHDNASAPSETVRATPADRVAPARPTGFTATRGDGQVDLSWTANPEPDVAGYRVLRDGAQIATTTGATYTDTAVVNDTTYSYALVAVDTSANASGAATASATPTDLTAPAVPTGVTAVDGGARVTVSWTANAEPDLAGYVVVRDGTEVASVPGTTYVDDLADEAAHGYAVVAVDTHGNRSAASATAEVPAADRRAPAAPTGLVATAGDGRVTLAWAANGEPDLASYRVLRDGVQITTVTGTTYTDTGVVNDSTYSYALVAVDTSANASGPSGAAVARPTDRTAPAVPAGFTAVRGDGQVDLSWTANGEPDLAGYVLLRDGVQIATPAGPTYTDPGMVNDRTYGYALVAVDTRGNRSGPATASATPTDLTPPAVPAGFTAVRGDGQVDLSWTANGEPDLAGYVLLRDGVQIATPAGPTYTDPGLVNDRTYGYALVAVDTHGNRSGPATASATPTDLTPPPAPTGVTATAGNRQAVLGWDAGGADVAGHRVLDVDGSTVATVPAPGTSATVTGLANGATYAFTVVAVDAGGNVSARSAAVTVTPVYATVPAEGAGESGGVAASSDGRFVVVGTRARLEPSDTNTAYELYVVDRTAGTRTRIAPLPATATGAGDATNTSVPAVSDDGRYVVLATTAALDPRDTNGLADVYRYDVGARSWALVSAPQGGTASPTVAGTLLQPAASVYATGPSAAVSGDGDLVLFYSARADLVLGDTNNRVDVFAKRLSDGTVTRISTTTTGGELSGPATGPALALTPDGRFAVFGADSASGVLAYRKTLSGAGAGELRVVSQVTTSTGRTLPFSVYRDTGDLAVSDDGRYVALVTSNRVTTTSPAQTWSTGLAYRVDTVSGAVVPLGTGQTTVWEHQVELDPTGRHAFFATTAAALPVDTNGHTDHYRRDLGGGAAGPLVLVTADASGRPTTGPTGAITPAEYGRLLAVTGDRVLVTTSQPLTPSDVNRLRDLYTKDLLTGAVGVGLG